MLQHRAMPNHLENAPPFLPAHNLLLLNSAGAVRALWAKATAHRSMKLAGCRDTNDTDTVQFSSFWWFSKDRIASSWVACANNDMIALSDDRRFFEICWFRLKQTSGWWLCSHQICNLHVNKNPNLRNPASSWIFKKQQSSKCCLD